MSKLTSCLYVGEVVHRRIAPLRHELRYKVYNLFVDVDALPNLGLKLLSYNRLNLFGVRDRDFGDGTNIREYIWGLVKRAPQGENIKRIFMMFCRKAIQWCVKRKPLSDDVKAMYLAPYDSPAHRIAVLKFVQTIPMKPGDPGYDVVVSIEESLKQFKDVPMLLLWGMKDFVFDEHFLLDWERHFPRATVHRFDDCGHYLLEDAGPEMLELIREFLNQT